MFVDTVIWPRPPAAATISASEATFLAFSTV